MRLLTLAKRIRNQYRSRGVLPTLRFLATRVARHQRHVVYEAVLNTEPEDAAWLEDERVNVIDSRNVGSAIGADLRAFLGSDVPDNLQGVREGNVLFVVANGSEYCHCGYILLRTRQTRIIGEPQGTPLIACCFTAPAARGRGVYRRALIAEMHHLWARGHKRVVIETSPENLPSRKGIEAAGFRFCREVSVWIILNCFVYQKRMEPSGATHKLIMV